MARLETLLKKREELEKQIAEAQAREKRKSAIVDLLEKAGIIDLPDEVLKAEFQKIAQAYFPNQQKSDSGIPTDQDID